jgi:hypothetical protein
LRITRREPGGLIGPEQTLRLRPAAGLLPGAFAAVTVEPAGPEAGGWALAPPPEADGEARFLTVMYALLCILLVGTLYICILLVYIYIYIYILLV